MKKLAIVLTAALLLLTGCGQTEEFTQSETADETVGETTPEGDIILTMAVTNDEAYGLQKSVQRFNELDNGYRIELKDYGSYIDSSYVEEDRLADGTSLEVVTDLQALDPIVFKLQMDILQGGEVDIVPDLAFSANMGKYEILLKKGAFADLYTFMENDPEINRSTLHAHVLELHETDGELRCLPLYYRVESMCGDPALVGSKENWTFADLESHWDAAPAGTTFYGQSTREYVYYGLIRSNLGSFVDYQNGTCRFDSPEFIRQLEFCSRFPAPEEKTDAGHERDFLHTMDCSGDQMFALETEGKTLVGYPSEDGCGGFLNAEGSRMSICRSSAPEKQAGAWEFLRMLASEDAQYARMSENDPEGGALEGGFPLNLAARERIAQDAIALGERGEQITGTAGGQAYTMDYLTRDQYARSCAYIDSIRRLTTNVDASLETIVSEELDRMFADECTPQEAAKQIQSRAEIMVSERS